MTDRTKLKIANVVLIFVSFTIAFFSLALYFHRSVGDLIRVLMGIYDLVLLWLLREDLRWRIAASERTTSPGSLRGSDPFGPRDLQ